MVFYDRGEELLDLFHPPEKSTTFEDQKANIFCKYTFKINNLIQTVLNQVIENRAFFSYDHRLA